MRTIVVSFLILAIIGLALIGSMIIFEVLDADAAVELLIKFEGGLLLLGGCTAAVYALVKGSKEQ